MIYKNVFKLYKYKSLCSHNRIHFFNDMKYFILSFQLYVCKFIKNIFAYRRLEEKLKKISLDQKESKSVQTEEEKQIEKPSVRLPPISCSEIQSSEVDTQDENVTSS